MNWLFKPAISEIWVFCDGGAGATREAGTPALDKSPQIQAGCGAAAFQPQGKLLEWAWQPLPPMTNNEAEYAGLLLGIELAQRLAATRILCLLDSAVVVGQMQGHVRVNSPALIRWHRRATARLNTHAAIEIRYIPREYNLLADALARQARLPWNRIEWLLRQNHSEAEHLGQA